MLLLSPLSLFSHYNTKCSARATYRLVLYTRGIVSLYFYHRACASDRSITINSITPSLQRWVSRKNFDLSVLFSSQYYRAVLVAWGSCTSRERAHFPRADRVRVHGDGAGFRGDAEGGIRAFLRGGGRGRYAVAAVATGVGVWVCVMDGRGRWDRRSNLFGVVFMQLLLPVRACLHACTTDVCMLSQSGLFLQIRCCRGDNNPFIFSEGFSICRVCFVCCCLCVLRT